MTDLADACWARMACRFSGPYLLNIAVGHSVAGKGIKMTSETTYRKVQLRGREKKTGHSYLHRHSEKIPTPLMSKTAAKNLKSGGW